MPASVMARLLASRVNPIALTPCSLPKRDVPTPTMAQVSLRLPMRRSAAVVSRLLGRDAERRARRRLPLVEGMEPAHAAQLLEARRAGALLVLPLGGEGARADLL